MMSDAIVRSWFHFFAFLALFLLVLAYSFCFIFLIFLIIIFTCSFSGVVSQYFLCSFFC